MIWSSQVKVGGIFFRLQVNGICKVKVGGIFFQTSKTIFTTLIIEI